jgi:LacI family transcriptional regulator
MRTTIAAIAAEAGVSTATVDRVLNNRPGVRERTRRNVIKVAERLGYSANGNGVQAKAPRLDFILPVGTNTYLKGFAEELEAIAARRSDAVISVHRLEGFEADRLAEALHSVKSHAEGVGVIAIDHPAVREAIRELAAADIPVLTMVSDILNVPRIGYVGIDNRAAGRLAGYLLGRLVRASEAEIALFAGSLSYRGHNEREMGFRHILAEEFSNLQVVELREVMDSFDRSYSEASALLRAYPNMAGIYNIGGGIRGIARALEESGRARDIVFVGHELTEHSRRFLVSGTMDAVIDQNLIVEVRDSVECLVHAARGEPLPNLAPIRLQVIFRENIPQV